MNAFGTASRASRCSAHAAPVFKGKFVESKNDLPPVWPDAEGEVKGYKIKPLYKSVPVAVKQDDTLYDYLAIVDVLRSGRAREVNVAIKIMHKIMKE